MGKKEPLCTIEDVVIHPALKEYFTYRFYKLALRLRSDVNRALEKQGIIGVQLGLLRVLEIEGPASQIALGRSLGIDKATMVKLLDGLESLGFIQRVAVEGDRRVKHVRVTPKGSRALAEGTRIRELVERKFFSALTREECQNLDKALSKLIG